MRRLLPFLTLLALVIAASIGGIAPSHAATAAPLAEGFLLNTTQVDGGTYFTCARTSDGQARCWGDNQVGQLGDGTTDDAPLPVTVLGPDGATPLTGVRQVSLGERHACALLTDGTVACWGRNVYGQLGDGSATDRHHAVIVHGVDNTGLLSGISQISIGAYSSCAATSGGQARCWGDSEFGQLGNNQGTSYQPTPVVVRNPLDTGPLTKVRRLSLGHQTVCALLRTGEARCWGQNYLGQVGDRTTVDRGLPRVVRASNGAGPMRQIVRIVPGYRMSCALLESGQVRCWGSNNHGNLGIGSSDYDEHLRPVAVRAPTGPGRLTNVRSIDVGEEHACAVLVNGQVRCWGRSQHGQQGDGAYTDRLRPVPVHGTDGTARLSGVTSLATGRYHSCARLGSGQLRCWGGNQERQLGNGDTFDQPVPVAVQG